MFYVERQSDLQQSINRMSVPVFVVDQDPQGEFRLIAANAAHARATGLSSDRVLGKTPHMILPDEADAELFVNRYKACIHRHRPIAYSSEITYLEELKAVDTILHPVSVDGGAPTRVVGQVTVTKIGAKGGGVRGERQATPDIQALRAKLEDILACHSIRSSDLMILGSLMKTCNLSPVEVARMAEICSAAQSAPDGPKALDRASGDTCAAPQAGLDG